MYLQLKKLRCAAGLSQDEMARRLEIKTSRYGTWERGERTISLPQAIACAEILGCSLDELGGRSTPAITYTDERQALLNDCYELLNEKSKSHMVEFVASYTADPNRRAS